MIWAEKSDAGILKKDTRKINAMDKENKTVNFADKQTGAEGTGKGGQNGRRFGSNAYDENKGNKK